MSLRLVHSRRVACWPWALRDLAPTGAFGAFCRGCAQPVAVPMAAQGETPSCVYCALDSGLLEPLDTPLGDAWLYADGRPQPNKEPR